jgi:hypothetical protein
VLLFWASLRRVRYPLIYRKGAAAVVLHWSGLAGLFEASAVVPLCRPAAPKSGAVDRSAAPCGPKYGRESVTLFELDVPFLAREASALSSGQEGASGSEASKERAMLALTDAYNRAQLSLRRGSPLAASQNMRSLATSCIASLRPGVLNRETMRVHMFQTRLYDVSQHQ